MPFINLMQTPMEEYAEKMARQLYHQFCCCCFDFAVPCDTTNLGWVDLAEPQKEVWKKLAWKTLTWVAMYPPPPSRN